jgi:hypothetical protein
MSESFLERLSRFTPDAGTLERDALLFAAGRRSARPNRGWIALATALAGTQALSLALLWPHATPPAGGLPESVTALPSSPAPSESATAQALDSPGLWSVRHSLLESDSEDRSPSARTVTIVDREPPLRAFGTPPSSILN